MLNLLLIPPLAALLNRHRGGWLATGHTQLARLDFSVGMGALVYLATGDWRFALTSVPAWFLGCLAPNGAWMQIENLSDIGWGALSGVFNVLGVWLLALVFGHHVWPLILIGPLKGPVYAAALRIGSIGNLPPPTEVLWGFAMGAAVALM